MFTDGYELQQQQISNKSVKIRNSFVVGRPSSGLRFDTAKIQIFSGLLNKPTNKCKYLSAVSYQGETCGESDQYSEAVYLRLL